MWSNYKKALFVNSAGSMETNGLAIMDNKVFAYTENTIDDLLSISKDGEWFEDHYWRMKSDKLIWYVLE